MTKIVVKRNGLKHEAIQALGLFSSDKAEKKFAEAFRTVSKQIEAALLYRAE